MNKEAFTSFIAKHFVITKKAAEETINMFTGAVIEAVRHKESVNLVGFGSFYALDVKSREGVNPKTREKMTIQAHRQPRFKAGQKLKNAANNK